jgi:hypothetical protein
VVEEFLGLHSLHIHMLDLEYFSSRASVLVTFMWSSFAVL